VIETEKRGFRFIGTGVSGGEFGALHGASIMPGGSQSAWSDVKPILQRIAAVAEDGTPCCDWVGPGGSGHFVKMIHNGIEYGDMQLISEAYFLLKHLKKMDNEAIASVFEHWNEGRLHSYLMEISAHVLRHQDKNGDYLIDKILDTAGQKGTGKWSVINAMELGMPLGLIASAVFERSLSSDKNLRVEAAKRLARDRKVDTVTDLSLVDDIEQALYASKLVSYAQGFAVLQKASDMFSWNLDLASIARMWRAGCIIRSAFLNDISDAYQASERPMHLLFATKFAAEMEQALKAWKGLVSKSLQAELPVPALSSALNYYLSLTTASLPANMIQAQRDFFGAHTFERIDMPRGEFFHEDWTGKGGNTHSGSYNV